MTDSEILELDAECSYLHRQGDMTAYEWSDVIVDAIPRLAYIETDYGKYAHDSEGEVIDIPFEESRAVGEWFSLLVAASLKP